MKIPVYRRSISYRRAHAADMSPAPVLEDAMGEEKFSQWQNASGALLGLYELPAALNRTVQAYKGAAQRWETEWKEAASLINAKEKPKEREETLEDSNAAEKKEGEKNFSSSRRMLQLNFARAEAFEPQTSGGGNANDPVRRLDEHFAKYMTRYGQNNDLLAQDYVILRRELGVLQEKEKQNQAQEMLKQGAGTFVQTAAMVRTPSALEAYMRDNLAAASREARAAGWNGKQIRGRMKTLRAQAVRHNVQAALQSGEMRQAETIYRHFSSFLSEEDQALLRRKLTARKADLAAAELWPQAHAMTAGAMEEDEEKLRLFSNNAAAGEDAEFAEDLHQALKARARQASLRHLRRRAQAYQTLASMDANADLTSVLREDCFDKDEFEQNQKVLRACQIRRGGRSVRGVFNRLQRQLMDGKLQEEDLRKSFGAGELSARDYWLLQGRRFSLQAGDSASQDRLLAAALSKFCRQNGLDEEQSDEVMYFVFAQGSNPSEQLAAAQTVKQIFLLQEKNQ